MKIKTMLVLQLTAILLFAGNLPATASSSEMNEKETVKSYVSPLFKGIIHYHVNVGDYVKKGQLLYELDDTDLKIEKQANDIDLEIKNFIFEKGKHLVKQGAISRSDFQQFMVDYKEAKANRDIIKSSQKKYKYYAPFSGTVVKQLYGEGTAVPDGGDFLKLVKGKVNIPANSPELTKVDMTNRWNTGLLKLKVKKGDIVKKGQLLFNTDTDLLEKKLDSAEYNLFIAKRQFLRSQKLQSSNINSIKELLLAKSNYSKALRDAMLIKLQIKQSSTYAPFDGKVTDIKKFTGSGVGQCKPILELTKV